MASQKDMKQHEPNSMSPDWSTFGDKGDKICRRCNYMNYCKCMWCGHCGQLATGTYGHWTTICRTVPWTGTIVQGHFCCPEGCELEEDKIA
jgi:hypothetical protein